MAPDPDLTARVRRLLVQHLPDGVAVSEITEKKMFGGIAFMLRGKLCAYIGGPDGLELMLRLGKEGAASALGAEGVRATTVKGRPFGGYITLDETAFDTLDHWVTQAMQHTLGLAVD